MFKVLAKTMTLPGKSEKFKKNITELAPKTRAYQGCVSYQVLQSKEDFAAHFNEPFTKEFEKTLEGVVTGDVEPYVCDFAVQTLGRDYYV